MSLPRYPDFKPVALGDREIIRAYMARSPSASCELNFPNIFIWRKSERPRYTVLHDTLCILLEPEFEPAYFLPPLGNGDVERSIRTCLSLVPRISRVPEAFAAVIGSPFLVAEDRDNFDYVYRSGDLIELRGKKYDGKRNRIRKFEAGYDHAYEPLGAINVEGCRRLLEAWYLEKENSDPYLKAEKDAIDEALSHFGVLDLKGGVVRVGGKVEAFTIGMPLTEDTALVQIEIANPALTGLAQWLNREFVRREWSGFRFINREQDMGVPGLRRAKLSYQPCRLLKKFNVLPQDRS